MKIIIENVSFDFDNGCRILKLKQNDCPTNLQNTYVGEIWNDIIPAKFSEIAMLENVEQRRVGIFCLGLERLIKEVNPKLVKENTIKKTTSWVNSNGVFETKKFSDTYKLFKVEGKHFNNSASLRSWQKIEDCYFVEFKDTSTDRIYMLWVDINSVKETNGIDRWDKNSDKKVTAIDCIAWTIQTDIPEGNIEKIVRQGDCILIKPITTRKTTMTKWVRHLTANEYKSLLVAES